MKVALVHYWLVGMRGGEKVLESLCDLYPDADIITHVVDRDNISDKLKQHTIRTTFIAKLPKAVRWYQKYLPLMPMALEQVDLTEYDLIISSESGPAKGVITRPDALHICYCHTPMRYVWDMYHTYLQEMGPATRWLMRLIVHYLKMWDFTTASRVDQFVSNSAYVASRIRKFYRRDAEVVCPPVAVDDFTPTDEKADYYLMVGQLAGYKRADLAVEAFNASGRPLVVIGEGEQYELLKSIAKPNVKIMGRQAFAVIQEHFAKAKALIFPGVEDFGIVPLEATASGTPVIAYAEGGALETVKDGETGVFFYEQTAAALNDTLDAFEADNKTWDVQVLRDWAYAFREERFKAEFNAVVEREWAKLHPAK